MRSSRTMNKAFPLRPHGPSASGRPRLRTSFAVVLSLTLAALAGCSTAPSWRTAEECETQRGKFPELCEGLPEWQIAKDFKALVDSTVTVDEKLDDPAALKRLDPRSRPQYRIGPQDELTVTVWASREIWTEITDQ